MCLVLYRTVALREVSGEHVRKIHLKRAFL